MLQALFGGYCRHSSFVVHRFVVCQWMVKARERERKVNVRNRSESDWK